MKKLRVPKRRKAKVPPAAHVARHRRREDPVVIPPWSEQGRGRKPSKRSYEGRHRVDAPRHQMDREGYRGRHRQGDPVPAGRGRYSGRGPYGVRVTPLDDRPNRQVGYYR